MPHTTHAYGFEAKVLKFSYELCLRFTTGESLRSFLLVLDRDGNVRSLRFEDVSSQWMENTREIVNSEGPHLFYDPLDDGLEYIWLSWRDIEQSVMERLIGQQFKEVDFRQFPTSPQERENYTRRISFPDRGPLCSDDRYALVTTVCYEALDLAH